VSRRLLAPPFFAKLADDRLISCRLCRPPSFALQWGNWMRAMLFLTVICSCLLAPASRAAAIHDAAKQGDTAAIAAALDAGADVNALDGGATPLYIAAVKGNLDAARLLVERGAAVNAPAKFGTPLYAAAKFGHAEMVALLLAS